MAVPRCTAKDSPGEQEATSATSCEGWSHAADVCRTNDTISVAIVLSEDQPQPHDILWIKKYKNAPTLPLNTYLL